MRTDGQTYGHDEANSGLSQFCERILKKLIRPWLAVMECYNFQRQESIRNVAHNNVAVHRTKTVQQPSGSVKDFQLALNSLWKPGKGGPCA